MRKCNLSQFQKSPLYTDENTIHTMKTNVNQINNAKEVIVKIIKNNNSVCDAVAAHNRNYDCQHKFVRTKYDE